MPAFYDEFFRKNREWLYLPRLIALACLLCKGSNTEKATALCQAYDEDGSGEIDPQGFDEIFDHLADISVMQLPKTCDEGDETVKKYLLELWRSRNKAKIKLMSALFPKSSHGEPITVE
jgi:hypothetical protein